VSAARKEHRNNRFLEITSALGRFWRHARPGLREHLIFWSITALGTALDLWTKKAVFSYISERGRFAIIDGFIQLIRAENPGAAFGIAVGYRYPLIVISVIALIGILAAFFLVSIRSKTFYIALGLFAAGVTGNLYDRIFNGGFVRDFIDVTYWPGRHWPAFNLADTMLCIAVALMIICTHTSPRQSTK